MSDDAVVIFVYLSHVRTAKVQMSKCESAVSSDASLFARKFQFEPRMTSAP